MILRRFALAIGLLVAVLASQLPEFTQQYRQRIGGAVDELTRIVAQFDQDSTALSLSREQGIARLRDNGDELARRRGEDMAATVARRDRLKRQAEGFAAAGPLSEYAVLAEDFDTGVARQTYADFQPALPASTAGLLCGFFGLAVGWIAAKLLARIIAWPMRRRRQTAALSNPH